MEIQQRYYNQKSWLIPLHQWVNLEHIGSCMKRPFTLVSVESLILWWSAVNSLILVTTAYLRYTPDIVYFHKREISELEKDSPAVSHQSWWRNACQLILLWPFLNSYTELGDMSSAVVTPERVLDGTHLERWVISRVTSSSQPATLLNSCKTNSQLSVQTEYEEVMERTQVKP